jgi:hypothetical protein
MKPETTDLKAMLLKQQVLYGTKQGSLRFSVDRTFFIRNRYSKVLSKYGFGSTWNLPSLVPFEPTFMGSIPNKKLVGS